MNGLAIGGDVCVRCGQTPRGVTHVCPAPVAAIPTPRRPHRCPICGGLGTVPPDFYSQLGAATSTARERCRACLGSGVIVA